MSLFSNFPQGGKKAGVQSISDGGTGATTAEAALANLGGFPKADGEALKTRIQPINLGGTGASEANEARQNLGAAAVKEMTKAEYDALAAIDPTTFYALTDVEADGVKIEVGSYVGTGTASADIIVGFTPKAVIVSDSAYLGKTDEYSAFILPGLPNDSGYVKRAEIIDNGFRVYYSGSTTTYKNAALNYSGSTYRYIAIG